MNVRRAFAVLAVPVVALAACGGDESGDGPGIVPVDQVETATYEFVIPLGAGEALDAGTPLEVLPGELVVSVGETIRIVNEDERGHNVGPWFVGAGEIVSQRFSSPGEFEGVCTVHPSGQLVLVVEA
ncbi:MAG: cupredoxin domain-containing protein [Ilumatobacteraceae bacterium]